MGSVGVFQSKVSLAPVRPGSESRVLRIGCLKVRGGNEVENRDELGSVLEEIIRFE